MALTIIQLHISFITHALICVLILALAVVKLHINLNTHPRAFLIHVLIKHIYILCITRTFYFLFYCARYYCMLCTYFDYFCMQQVSYPNVDCLNVKIKNNFPCISLRCCFLFLNMMVI